MDMTIINSIDLSAIHGLLNDLGSKETMIDCASLFLIAMIIIVGVYLTYQRSEAQDERKTYEEMLKHRLAQLSKQQDDLLNDAAHKASTFSKTAHASIDTTKKSSFNLHQQIIYIMQRGGITDLSVPAFVAICSVGSAIFAALIVYFDFLHPAAGAPMGLALGAYFSFNILVLRVNSKKMAFLKQFPDTIDMMIRGVKAGLNIQRIMKLVSLEMKDPIAGEFKIISQKLDLGIELEKVLVEAANRIGVEEFRFLVVALVLQLEHGGMLGEILHNLSGMVRKRLELDLKLKAMSAEARMSAIVLSALPFLFAGVMAFLNPEHLNEFTKTELGNTLLKVLVVLFSLGIFFMFKATKIKV